MRHLTAVAGLLLLVACGAGGSTSPTPPPPPPPPTAPGPPASVSIQAGDNQETAPGMTVPVVPAVVVKDAASRPVPGVSVTFAVNGGGGTIAGPTATTGGDGVAKGGEWTLGPMEGTNQLTASVASLPAITFHATGLFPTVLLADATLGPSGGTIGYVKAGDPLNGTRLTIPAGAYSGTSHWRIEARSAATGPSIPNLRITDPIVIVSTDQGLSDSLLLLTIPRRTAPDSTVVALGWNASSGTYEGVPVAGMTDTSFTIATRHFSGQLLLQPAGPASIPFSAPTLQPLPFNMAILTAAFPSNAAAAFGAFQSGTVVSTVFDPAVDAWEFPNNGSYITPAGQVTGTSLSELYYSYARIGSPTAPALFGAYNPNFPAFWAGNNLGYRVAALAETDVDWPRTRAAILALENGSLFNRVLNTRNVDQLTYFSLVAVMALRRQPQILIADGPPASGGYIGLLVYEATPTALMAADPDHPGGTITIPFVNGHFQAVQLGAMTGVPPFTSTRFHFAAASALINFARIGINFTAMLQGGPVGAAAFPGYSLQYFDADLQVWAALSGAPITIDWTDVQLRALCPTCQHAIPGPVAGLAALDVYDTRETQIGTDRTTGTVTFKVPPGGETVGIHVLGGVDPCGGCPTAWRHVDFQIQTIRASEIYITPDPAFGVSSTPLKLTAKNLAPSTPPNARYFWSFGDGQSAQASGDSTILHTWAAGTWTVHVVVVDLATGNPLGKASVTVKIDQAVPIWQFTQMTKTVTGQVFLTDFGGVNNIFFDRDVTGFIDNFYFRPDTGLLYFMGSPFTVAGQTFTAGVYLQQFLFAPGFDPRLSRFEVLGRPTVGPYVDAFFDDLKLDASTVAGDLDNGSFSGHSVTRTRDLTGWPGVGGVHTAAHWQVSATKNGTLLNGNITYFLEQWVVACSDPTNSASCAGTFAGTFKVSYDFTARRIR